MGNVVDCRGDRGVITKDDMIGVLIDGCPSFAPRWQEFTEEWQEERDLPLYLALSDFARHLIGLLERGETAGFPAIFAAIERLHVEGEPYVTEAATVGLLENLQNLNLHSTTRPEQFRSHLGPVSARWWDKLYQFWDRGDLLSED